MVESNELLPRHTHTSTSTSTVPNTSIMEQPPSSSNNKYRRRRRPPPAKRSKPPSQDRLVVVFITATAIFSLITISPFIFGHFPSHHHDIEDDIIPDWIHKHGDGQGGILDNIAGNKTALAWHYFMGKQQQAQEQQKLQQQGGALGHTNKIGILSQDDTALPPLPLARGISGLPFSKTPALVGAKHGSIQCPNNQNSNFRMDTLAYWNEPQGSFDTTFVSPFGPLTEEERNENRYVTFEPDRGGWNNIRMSLEIVIVFAKATGRTLVLPPDTPFYLLSKKVEGKKKKQHGFADFLDLDNEALLKQVPMISMKEFLELEGSETGEGKMFKLPSGAEGKKLWKSAEECYYVAKSDRPCDHIYGFLRDEAYVPEIQAGRDCLIFDSDEERAHVEYTDSELFDLLPEEKQQRITEFCDKRNPIFFGNELATAPLIHFHAGEKHHRLLNHFYTFLYFTDVKVDHHFKRFVRDFLHYTDTVWCAAGRVLNILQEEATTAGWSSMHVRRGDFQYKKVKKCHWLLHHLCVPISATVASFVSSPCLTVAVSACFVSSQVKITADDWYDNTKDLFKPNEIVYIATDEKNNTFFEPLKEKYNLRFLNDYMETAGLKDLDPNLMGMIDTIIASQGRLFVGTWFSTFTGYIVSASSAICQIFCFISGLLEI